MLLQFNHDDDADDDDDDNDNMLLRFIFHREESN